MEISDFLIDLKSYILRKPDFLIDLKSFTTPLLYRSQSGAVRFLKECVIWNISRLCCAAHLRHHELSLIRSIMRACVANSVPGTYAITVQKRQERDDIGGFNDMDSR